VATSLVFETECLAVVWGLEIKKGAMEGLPLGLLLLFDQEIVE